MMRFFFLLMIGFLTAGNLYAAEFKNTPPLTNEMTRLKLFEKPEKLPQVVLSSIDKGTTYLSEFRGQITLVNLWATWCPPCVKELPSLNALQFSMDPRYFQVVTASLDQTGLDKVKQYLASNNLTKLPAYVDANGDLQRLDVLRDMPGIPISLILDPQLRVLAIYQGDADWSGAAARAVLDYYLKNVSYSPIEGMAM